MNRTLLIVASTLLAADAAGQAVVEALYLQNQFLAGADALPGFDGGSGPFDPGDVFRENGSRSIRATPSGSFATPVNTGEINDFTSGAGVFYLFGSDEPAGANAAALRREATIGGVQQVTFGSQAAIDNAGVVTYTASIPNPGAGPSRLSSLWEDDTLLFTQGVAIPNGPLQGAFYGVPAGVDRAPGGAVSWVTSYASTALGEPTGTALMRNPASNEVILKSGDTVPGLGTVPFDAGVISGNINWSLAGGSYITEVGTPNGGTNNQGEPTYDSVLVVNGVAETTASGALIRESLVIPPDDGGLPNEVWSALALYDVNESGDYALAAFTDFGFDAQGRESGHVLMVNGEVLFREGQTVDGVALDGQVQAVGINDRGDLAFAWNDTVFINGQVVAGSTLVNDADGVPIAGPATLVDLDGDGVADAVDADSDGVFESALGSDGIALDKFEITNLPAAGGGGLPVVYFAGELADTTDALFRLAPSDPSMGDFNGDGVADAADYTVWRDTLGSTLLLGADADGSGVIDAADYVAWKLNFSNSAAEANTAAVPEPASLLFAFIAWAILRRTKARKPVGG